MSKIQELEEMLYLKEIYIQEIEEKLKAAEEKICLVMPETSGISDAKLSGKIS
jgi:hypothetical protein